MAYQGLSCCIVLLEQTIKKIEYGEKIVGNLFMATDGIWGAQWLGGRVLDSRPKGRGAAGSSLHQRHCVVSLSKTHLSLLGTGSTQEDLSHHNCKIVDWGVKNQVKQTKLIVFVEN